MKLDFKEIINIKNLKDLKKHKLDKPIHLENYLFHYLIIFDKLDILKLYDFPIWKENEEGLNGFMLAAKEGNINILKYLITKYPDYIYNTNDNDDLFINLMEIKTICEIINLKLNWKYLLEYRLAPDSNDTIFDTILSNGTFKQINEVLNVYKTQKPLNYLLINENLSDKEIISILKLFKPEQYNLRNENDTNLIFTERVEVVKFLINNNFEIDIDYYTIITTLNPLRNAFIIKNLELCQLLWDKIKDKFNFEATNKYLENIAHSLLKLNSDDKLVLEILSKCPDSVWNQPNIYKITPFQQLIKLDYNKFNSLVKDRTVDLQFINFTNVNKNWETLLKKLPKYDTTCKLKINCVEIEEYKYTHGNQFQAKFKDVSMIIIYLKEKYKNLYMPNLDNYSLNNLNYDDNLGLMWPDSLIELNPIFPWIICYEDENNYWYHNNLNNLINAQRREKKYDFSFCYLSIVIKGGGLHANILIWNFNNLTIERFDPYGNVVNFDTKIDNILEEELTWNTGFTYLKPSDFMPIAGFQTIADELNPLYQKSGDYGGYCLAWCTWYLEHRIKNKNVSPKNLVDKLLKKLSYDKDSFMDYIRNYANKLNTFRVNNYKKLGIDIKTTSNTNIDNKTNRILNSYIVKYFKSY